MERNTQKSGGLNLFLLIAMAAGTFAVSRYANLLAGQVTTGFLLLGIVIAAVTWFQMRLEDRERLEKLEVDELTKGGASSGTLFGDRDADVFPLRRSREQFERFFIPGLTVMLVILQAAGFWLAWRWLNRLGAPPPVHQPLVAMSILGLMALIAF